MAELPFAEPAGPVTLDPGAVLLPGFALDAAPALLRGIAEVAAAAPFRVQETPGGRPMSVAMTSAGAWGWVSDRRGYRYEARDPATGRPWPPMPEGLMSLAERAAEAAGLGPFAPDSCLVNSYEPGARMGLHQDRDEADFTQPIVSVSLGVSAVFLWAGPRRAAPRRFTLRHGDVVAWGGRSRLAFHGIAPLAAGDHFATGALRLNLTFRRAKCMLKDEEP